tara:strand:+ start:21278 stop:21556 length:279 start_codon:yes stop_codon:yes gene_type:complete
MTSTKTSMAPSSQESDFLDSFLSREIKFIDHEEFDSANFSHKQYPLEKEPVWTWAHAMLGDFDESDVKSIELELLTKDEEQAVFLHMKFFFI